jgi:hypothetical protein
MMKRTAILFFTISCLILAACNAPLPGPETGSAPVTDSQPVANQPAQTADQSTTLTLTTGLTYPIVDTGQTTCYDNDSAITCSQTGEAFAGQDANYQGLAPAYQDNGDGTVTDLNTGLMWQQTPDFNGDGAINAQDKMSHADALQNADSFTLAGYDDWRLPTIQELYSLMDFRGATGTADPSSSQVPSDAVPFIDTAYFDFAYGDASTGERYIDAQYWSSTMYVSTTMNGNATAFGVNFADGRIKGYGSEVRDPNGRDNRYVRYVRGNTYGTNSFVDNGNGTITDNGTGLTWMQSDSGSFSVGPYGDGSLNWEQALAWCEGLDYAGASDWRLPNAKELHSIVDYTRSPDTTNSAAINPLFQATYLPNGINNNGYGNYPHYWSSTTHLDGVPNAARAVYFAFGEAQGLMNGQMLDVHGAGAQRSDMKSGDPSSLPVGAGPQGDVQSIYNYVRCVRSGSANASTNTSAPASQPQGGQQPAGQTQPTGQVGGVQGQQGQQPPQEAIVACSGLSVGSACSINTPNGTVNGTCGTPPNSTLIACMPAGGPPP